MLRTLVGLAMLWTVQSQRCTSDAQCPPKQHCRDDSFVHGECRCPGDWKGVDCDCSATITCNGNGKCNADSECDCTPGWVGAGCDVDCEDARDCRGRGTCEQDGSCGCSGDWIGPRCDCSPSETCNSNGACDPSTLECTCVPGWTGVYCNIPCAPGTTCDSQGTCGTDQDCGENQHCDTFNCLCDQGWIGTNCDEPCTLCNNNGYCDSKTIFGLPCICDDNWSGSWCEVRLPPCDLDCGHGKCNDARTACICDGDWVDSGLWHWTAENTGEHCDCSPSVTCNGNGKCEGDDRKDGSPCKCDDGWLDGWVPGWVGSPCVVPCEVTHRGKKCSGHGECSPDYLCLCDAGWWSEDCSVFCDPSTTCNGRGYCNWTGVCSCDQGFDDATNCQKCLPHYYGHDCNVYCSGDVTCNGNGACDASGKCLCDAYNATADCGNQAAIYGDPHYLNVDNEVYDFHGADPSGYYAYTDDEVSVTTWNYFCDETLHKGMTCVQRVAILQKSNGDMVEFKRTDIGMQTSVKLTSRPTPCQASFMNLSSWSPSIELPTSMRYEAPQHERGATVSLLDAAGRVKMLLTVWYEEFMTGRDPLLNFALNVHAVLYQKRPVSLDGELGAFYL